MAAVAIVATYAAGWTVGRWVHRLNDALAAAVTGRPAPPPLPARVTVKRQAAAVASPGNVAPPARHTVAQLRIMARAAGHRSLARSGRRAELLAVLGMKS